MKCISTTFPRQKTLRHALHCLLEQRRAYACTRINFLHSPGNLALLAQYSCKSHQAHRTQAGATSKPDSSISCTIREWHASHRSTIVPSWVIVPHTGDFPVYHWKLAGYNHRLCRFSAENKTGTITWQLLTKRKSTFDNIGACLQYLSRLTFAGSLVLEATM